MSAVPLLSMLMTKPLQTSEYFQDADQNLHGRVGFSNVGNPSFSDIGALRRLLDVDPAPPTSIRRLAQDQRWPVIQSGSTKGTLGTLLLGEAVRLLG